MAKIAIFLPMLLLGCGHPPGPRPALTGVRVGPAGPDGRSSLFASVRADFQEIGHLTDGKKVEHLLHAITFTTESRSGDKADRHIPVVVVGSLHTVKLNDKYADRVRLELIVFPQDFGGKQLRFRAKSVFEIDGEEASFVDVEVPSGSESPPVRLQEMILGERGEKRTIEVHLDRDVPAAYRLWHCLEGRAHPLERRSPRVYVREFDPPEVADHRVVIDAGTGWLSPPLEPKAPKGDDDELDEEES